MGSEHVLHVNVSGDQSQILGLEENEGEEGPVLLAQIEGPQGKQTQTVIIQAPPGSKLDSNNLTPEIYEVLRNLSQRVGNPEGTNIMVSQINQEPADNMLLGMEGFNVGATAQEQGTEDSKDYMQVAQNQQTEGYIEQLPSNVKSALGMNRVIVSDGDKQIEVDISPTFQDYTNNVKLETQDMPTTTVAEFFQPEDSTVTSLPSFENQPQNQLIMADEATGTPIQSTQEFLPQDQQQEQQVLVQIDDNLGLSGGVSFDQLQQLLQQQQILQQLQGGSNQQVDISQLNLDASQLGAGDQVQLGASQVQIGANQLNLGAGQVQLGEQFSLPIASQQHQQQQVQVGDQVPYQVQISSEQVPQQVQLLADQVLGQQ